MCRFFSFNLIFLSLMLCFVSVPVDSTSISINNNGYSNIVVAISPDVPNTYAELIVKNIKLMIGRASSVLYRATKQRAYFKDVRVLVPEFWSNVKANVSTWETYSTADVRVAPAGSAHGDTPYTVQSGGCGQSGEYIHMTPSYLQSINEPNNTLTFGRAEKVFVHEWSHLRYGVFDEFGQQGNDNFPLFYKPSPESVESIPNLCSNEPPIYTTKDEITQGPCRVDPATGVYDKNCVYSLQPNFLPDSSLMSLYTVDSVVDFCQDDQSLRHVYFAPTKHNTMCELYSVWSIIQKHQDFANNNNPPSNLVYLEPNFQIIKSAGSRFVLVMDTSGSMKDFNRITRLYESSRRWIKYDIADGSQLGMVQFDTQARILSPLIMINGDASRESLISRLPINAVGGTCIGCGLRKALEVLRSGGPGGVILLVTDGEETDRPYIYEVLQEVISADVRVVSIAFGRAAEDKIEELAAQTNGKSYFINDNDSSQGLNDAFTGSLTYQPAVPSDQIIVLLFQRQYTNVPSGTISDTFSVDYTVGRNLVFRIDYTQKSYLRSFSLRSPSGTEYTQLEYDDVAKVAMFKLPEAEVGKWYFTLIVNTFTSDSLAVHVTSRTRSTTTAPITTECYVPEGSTINNANTSPVRILAKVMQGNNPVIQARVKAYVEIPSGPVEILELFDNGASADTTANDGIYSRYFTSASVQGRYTVECEIWGDGTAFVNDGFATRNIGTFRKGSSKNIGLFTRMADGGSFKITQPVTNISNPYPPSRVVDLNVVDVNPKDNNRNESITIQFTAPGDDLDLGTALNYEIRYSTMFDDLRPTSFGSSRNSTLVVQEHVSNGSLQPLPSGSKQIITFMVGSNLQAKTYYVAMRAVDKSGLVGPVSNVVSAPFLAEEDLSTSGLSTKAIVGIVIGAFLAILLIAGIAYLIARRKYLSYGKTNTRPDQP